MHNQHPVVLDLLVGRLESPLYTSRLGSPPYTRRYSCSSPIVIVAIPSLESTTFIARLAKMAAFS